MVKIVKMLCPSEKRDIKFPYAMKPAFIVVHNTANKASARNENHYMCSNNKYVSFHFVVDDVEIIQNLPLDRNGWHAGDGPDGKGNRYGIAIEICYSKSGGKKFELAERNAAELVAHLLKEYGWGIDKVTKHQDYSGKYCPHRTLDLGWTRFLKMVQIELAELEERPDQHTRFNEGDKVKIIGKYYANTPEPVKVSAWAKSRTHTIKEFNRDHTKARLLEINSWVYVKDIEHAKKAIIEGSMVNIKDGATYGGLSSARGKRVPDYVRFTTDEKGKKKAIEYKIIGFATHHGVKEARLEGINSWVPVKYLY